LIKNKPIIEFVKILIFSERRNLMLLAKRIILKPTKPQTEQFFKFSGTARFAYNECLAYKISLYKNNNKKTNTKDCVKHLQELKATEEFSWIKETPEAVTKQAVKDLDKAYKNFFSRGNKGFPKFKKKGKCTTGFFQRTDRFKQTDKTHVKITGIKEPVKCSKCDIPEKVYNTRVSFDGKYWYLSYSYDVEPDNTPNTDKVIGVDLGIKNLAVCSNGMTFSNINKDRVVKKLEKRKKRLQRQVSRKYETNRQGKKFIKTNNIKKLEQKIRLIDRRLSNIRNNHIHNMTKTLARIKPKAVVIEDLNVSGMMKNKYLSKAVKEQEFRKSRTQIEYKSVLYGFEVVAAPRFYPSSKKCSRCGCIKKDLKLSDRIYVCENCGLIIDRDLNAGINLENYYYERNSLLAC
jgi:putative transposase